MDFNTVGPAVAFIAIFVVLLVLLKVLHNQHRSFTVRVFSALGMGAVFGAVMQAVLGVGSDAATTALDWIAIVGQGYVALLRMLVMPLVFISIVGAFTRAKVTENFGKISGVVLAVLLGTVAIAAFVGWAVIAFGGLAGASISEGAVDATSMANIEAHQETVSGLTLPQTIISFIPTNVFSDLAGSRSSSTIAVVVFSAFLGVAYLKLRDRAPEQAEFFAKLIDSLNGIIMRVVSMVMGLTPYGVLALITNVLATSEVSAIVQLGQFLLASYIALLTMFIVHAIILLANRVSPITYFKKVSPVLSLAFVSRASAGALPLNIETQEHALGVDTASANLAGSFGLSIGQNGCAGIYPAMLATIIAPTVGIDVFSPAFVIGLIAVVVISSFGVAGVGGGATFASLIVLGTLNLPVSIVGVLASIEPLIDMGRTALNVDDSMVAGVTAANVCGTLDRSVLTDPTAQVSASEQ